MSRQPSPTVLAALRAISAGAAPNAVESQELDFKELARRENDALRTVAAAAICFANASGGTIVLGVDDDVAGDAAFVGTTIDPGLVRRRIYELAQPNLTVQAFEHVHAGNRLVIVEVPEGLEIYADPQGKATVRRGTDCLPLPPTEAALLREERRGIDWSAQPSHLGLADLDTHATLQARAYLRRFPDSRRQLADASIGDLLTGLKLINADGQLLRAAEVLFCDRGVPLVYRYQETPGGEARSEYRASVPMLLAFDDVLRRVDERAEMTPVVLNNGQQIPVRDFPELAVREAVVNGLVHRDYHSHDSVQVEHSPEMFSVISPGPLVSGITKDNILTHPPRPRNPLLAAAAHQLGLAEELGKGVDRMYREMIKLGKSPPDYESSAISTRVSLFGGAPNQRMAKYTAQLPAREQEDVDTMLVLFTLVAKQRITAGEVAPVLQRTEEASEVILRRLADDAVAMIAPTQRSARAAHPTYRLRSEVVQALGPALRYRVTTRDEIDRKIIRLVKTNGTIDSRTLQIVFDLDIQGAAYRLRRLQDEQVLEKLGEQQRGPGIKYGPGIKFPTSKPRACARSDQD